ncbi:MAG: HD-GYP domain-containing protein [Carboxydocellales bacterium]
MSFLIICALGIILAYTFTEYFQKEVIMVSAERTADTVKILISYSLRPDDFQGKMSQQRYRQLHTVMEENVLAEENRQVIIWNTNGEVVFSNLEEITGHKYPKSDALKVALRGKLAAELVDFREVQDFVLNLDRSKKFININVPIRIKGSDQIIGVFQVYREAGSMYDTIMEGQKFGRFFIALSFTVLYVSLYQIVKKASMTIEEQDQVLHSLTYRLDDTMKTQEQSHVGTIKALMVALDAKDKYTAGHCGRVTDYAITLGRHLGLTEQQITILEEASLFHDIGKIGVPELILNKKEALGNEEFEVIKKHPAIGADIIASTSTFKEHAIIVRHHHERWDGFGYPDQLKGEEIPLEARILAVADTYDAMTSDRPYRSRMPREKAIKILRECVGTQFDPVIANKFLEIII